tara:strand:+ start:174 stop:1481 length:1308 start_codon:yes stop_codon:yes gene_type:complete
MKTYNKVYPFSHVRLRQVINDLKRRNIDAAKDLNMNLKKFNNVLNGKKKLDEKILSKIVDRWPVKFSEFLNPVINKKNFKIMKSGESLKSSRFMQRKGNEYYEYRDTVAERNAPFKPEWIRELCYVENNKPNNGKIKWNKGHLLHQFTYFIGKVNFYYKEKNKKKVAIMNTGDSMYITPYIPHSFATRDINKKSFIVAITYEDRINSEIQNELLNIEEKKIGNFLINKSSKRKIVANLINKYLNNLSISLEELKRRVKIPGINKILAGKSDIGVMQLKKIAESLNLNLKDLMPVETSKKVVVLKGNSAKKWHFPSNTKKYFLIKELASIVDVPSAKSIELNVLKKNNYKFKISPHQYIYVLSKKGNIIINNKIFNLRNGETLYLKPFTEHFFPKKGESFLILRVEGKISGDTQMQISNLDFKSLKRVRMESLQWF